MRLSIHAELDYHFDEATDILLQVEAAQLDNQRVASDAILTASHAVAGRVAAQDRVGERIWLTVAGRLTVDYRAIVDVTRPAIDCGAIDQLPLCALPGEVVQYLMGSRYCPSDRFETFVDARFSGLRGGHRVLAMRDWIHGHVAYVPGSSNANTIADDTFVGREGICRDFAHLLISFARAAGVPARMASVYALGVEPPDFHAVAEVYLGGAWHLVDATGMARADRMAIIGVGRDAADVAFLTAFGMATLNDQSVEVSAVE